MDSSTLLSIKNFSEFTGIKQSTLRYYDEIGLLSPVARGENNYRYYTPDQIIVLNFIKVLINLNVPLSTIKDLLINRTPESILELLGQQEIKLDAQLHALQTAYSVVHTFRENIQAGLLADISKFSVRVLEETSVIIGDTNTFDETGIFYKPFIEFCNKAEEKRINLDYPIGGYHESFDAFYKTPGQPDRWFSLDPRGNYKRQAGLHLVGYTQGYYGVFGDLPQKMVDYAQAHDLMIHGPVFVIYLLDEVSMIDPSKYLAQITVGVKKK